MLYICIICMGVVLYLDVQEAGAASRLRRKTNDTTSNDSSFYCTILRVVYQS